MTFLQNRPSHAKSFIDSINPGGATNFYASLATSMLLLMEGMKEPELKDATTLVFFMTDGTATVGITDEEVILQTLGYVTNSASIALNVISLGDETNPQFLKRLALENNGLLLKLPINAADAALQMQSFYLESVKHATGLNSGFKNVEIEFFLDGLVVDGLSNTFFQSYTLDQEIVIGGVIMKNGIGGRGQIFTDDYDFSEGDGFEIPEGAKYVIRYQDEYGRNQTIEMPFLATPSDFAERSLDAGFVGGNDLKGVVGKSYGGVRIEISEFFEKENFLPKKFNFRTFFQFSILFSFFIQKNISNFTVSP